MPLQKTYKNDKHFRNQRITPEAAKASLKYGFETMRLDRIVAITSPTNLASQRVMTKAGLK